MKQNRGQSGFTLVELMIVVAIIGILSTTAFPSFSRTVKRSRTAESAAHLNKIWVSSVTYYEADHANSATAVMPKQFPASGTSSQETDCCGNANGRCPGNASIYQTDATWMALTFNIADPHLYRPVYSGSGTGSASVFTADVNGDLDCDGIASTFRRRGNITAGEVNGASAAYAVRELE